jgi:hypothetical protein
MGRSGEGVAQIPTGYSFSVIYTMYLKNLNQDKRSEGRGLNPVPSEYEESE